MTAVTEVVVVIGAGSIGQAIARRVSAGQHVLLADLRLDNAESASTAVSPPPTSTATSTPLDTYQPKNTDSQPERTGGPGRSPGTRSSRVRSCAMRRRQDSLRASAPKEWETARTSVARLHRRLVVAVDAGRWNGRGSTEGSRPLRSARGGCCRTSLTGGLDHRSPRGRQPLASTEAPTTLAPDPEPSR